MNDDKDNKVAHELIAEFGGTDNVGRLRSAIATALAAARVAGAKDERRRTKQFVKALKKQINDYIWGPVADEVIDKVLADLEAAAREGE